MSFLDNGSKFKLISNKAENTPFLKISLCGSKLSKRNLLGGRAHFWIVLPASVKAYRDFPGETYVFRFKFDLHKE